MNEAVITRFLNLLAGEPALQDFARNRQLNVHYRLSDPDLEFHTVFANGSVIAGFGSASGEPDLILKMTASVFDGVMSGRMNGTTAAMSGKMRFSGDTMKAMSAQKIQKDLIRLYNQAREEAGL